MDIVNINVGTQLYKTVSYPCSSIKSYMNNNPDKPCYTNKMLWLSEDLNRALSYGSDVKVFEVKNDLNLINLMSDNIPNFLNEKLDDESIINSVILRVISRNSLNLREQAINLYGFLTGSTLYSVNVQLSILKSIKDNIEDYSNLFTFDSNTIGQIMITPDQKNFKDVIDGYISIGNKLTIDQLKLKNQRLSIYGLDQILLKLLCLNEIIYPNQIHGWYVPRNTQTVWTEIVNGKQVSDMGEIALFDCSNLVECSIKGSIKKKTKRNTRKIKSRQNIHKSKKPKSKKPKSKKPTSKKPKSKTNPKSKTKPKSKYMLN